MTEEDFDDEVEWDEYMRMSPAEQEAADRRLDAELQRLMQERQNYLDSLTLSERVAYMRNSWLRNIRENRKRLRDTRLNRIEIINQFWRQGLRIGQLELVKLREYRRTGIYPGRA